MGILNPFLISSLLFSKNLCYKTASTTGAEIFEDYPYTPLEQSTPSIRLLRIQPDGHGSITGWLEAYSLDDPNCPTFTTLSYVWGPKKYSQKILVNGHLFSVLSSLYPILEISANDKNLRHSCGLWQLGVVKMVCGRV